MFPLHFVLSSWFSLQVRRKFSTLNFRLEDDGLGLKSIGLELECWILTRRESCGWW